MSDELNTNELDKAMEENSKKTPEQPEPMPAEEVKDSRADDEEAEPFTMSDEEVEETKTATFNPFFDMKNMEIDKRHQFRCVSNIYVKEMPDKFTGGTSKRMLVDVEELDSGNIYCLIAQKDPGKSGKYSSITQALRKLYALTDGKPLNKYFALTKRMYDHETYGETASYNLNLINIE